MNKADHDQNALRQQLREATKAAHHRIDHHPLMSPLVRDELSILQYGDALLGLYAFHAPSEAVFAAARPEVAPPRRSAWLAEDLRRLDRGGDLAAVDLPRWNGVAPASPAEYVGMRYVIEGGALGGRALLPSLRNRLPAAGRAATVFFDGQQDPQDWVAFWALAERLAPFDPAAAVAAAVRFFAEIEALADRHCAWRRSRGIT